jgi:hypothetical protein
MTAPDPGWHPDPSGRHEYRYWDGASWTDDVADNAVTSVDPVAEAAAPTAADQAPYPPADATAPYEPTSHPPIDPAPTMPLDATRADDRQWLGGPTAYGDQPYADQPYGTGGVPPPPPQRTGPPTGPIVAGAVILVALLVGLAVLLTRGDDGETSADDVTDTTAEDTATTVTTAEATTTTTAAAGADPGPTSVFALSVGDCVTDEAGATGEVESVTIVDCGQPHELEVFHRHDIEGESLPDATGIDTLVREQCLPTFEQFVGLDLDSSALDVHYFSPTSDSWDAGDRELLCLVTDPSGPVTGSLEGAAR